MPLVFAWFRIFLLTTSIELLVAVPLLGREQGYVRRGAAVLLGQLASHPLVWFVWPAFGFSRPGYLALAESWAVAVEWLTYRLVFPTLSWQRALAISALSNGASLAVGTLLRS
jgi:hypothetical protein